jgi:histidinol-phosphate phosphatase family protein
VRLQAGNADDVLMRAVHGRDWRTRAGVPHGRRRRHLAITIAGGVAVAAVLAGRRRLALAGALAWLAGTAELALARIAPGPRTPVEVATMMITSAVLPAAATYYYARGWIAFLLGETRGPRTLGQAGAMSRPRSVSPSTPPPVSRGELVRPRPRAVLLDRDGTLVVDVPYNGDPDRVRPVPRAREALDRLRRAGIALAVVSNQSGVARGVLRLEQVHAVNRRVEAILGPLGPWFVCPHGPEDGCACRKPASGLVVEAAAALGVSPAECAVIGDTGADVDAARAAGARAVLVPTPVTRREEVAAAPEVATDLVAAVELLIGWAA